MTEDKHGHKDGFIPQYVLEQLAEKGNDAAAETIAKRAELTEKKT